MPESNQPYEWSPLTQREIERERGRVRDTGGGDGNVEVGKSSDARVLTASRHTIILLLQMQIACASRADLLDCCASNKSTMCCHSAEVFSMPLADSWAQPTYRKSLH